MANLQLRVQGGTGRPIALGDDTIKIGRHPDNSLRVDDEKSSRHHCVIEREGNAFYLRDLGSRNGTRLNGERVQRAMLSIGDMISVGKVDMVVEPRGVAGADPRGGEPSVKGSPWVEELERLLSRLEGPRGGDDSVRLVDADGGSNEALMSAAPGPTVLRMLLRIASRATATDLHVEPRAETVHVRMRIDGQMVWLAELPSRVGELMGGLIKTACQMPQTHSEAVLDGHFSARFPDRRVEYRVSFTPSVHGQKLVIRVLDQRGVPTSLDDLKMVSYMGDKIKKFCEQDAGMLLCCGPTGSGKTTTLYNALREINRDTRNVVTIEDPIEYQIEGVTQIPVDSRRGNDFNALLRSVLRQDPDVILVGEIRDEGTARTAMQAAMTGHLVFSTVHSKDTVSAIFRLLDLKVEPYLVANSLQLVMAQRLVRALCDVCKASSTVPPGTATRMGRHLGNVTSIYHSVGCEACFRTGYRGRRALFELLNVDDELRDVILGQPTIAAIKKCIAGGHFTTLAQFGYRLVAEGSTSLEEIDKIAGSDG